MEYKSLDKLIQIQKRLGEKVCKTLKDLKGKPENALGVDASYSRKYGGVAVAALVNASGTLIDYGVAVGEPPLEYIPGLLAFREAPLFYAAMQEILEKYRVDVVLIDGHGLSHPRHAGIASHLGLAISKPTIGVAKRKLYGKVVELKEDNRVRIGVLEVIGYLVEPRSEAKLAAVVKLSTGRRLYVSPGAYISLDSAVKVVSLYSRSGRSLPLPTYYADSISRMIARKLDKGALNPSELRKRPKITDFL